jgi:DNA-binding beta-propeller fold protein YncE
VKLRRPTTRSWIRAGAVALVACIAFGAGGLNRVRVSILDGSYLLPNGVRVRPVGRKVIRLNGDLPLAMLGSADGKRCYVVTGGFHDHGIAVLDLHDEVGDVFLPSTKCTGGIVESGPSEGYFTAGDLGIRRFRVTVAQDAWSPVDFKLPEGVWLQGLGLLPDGDLVASDINHDLVLRLDPRTHQTKWTAHVGHKPNRVAVDAAHKVIAVTDWGGCSVDLLNFDGTSIKRVAVGVHPSELAFGKDGTLFVSNAGSNTVSVIRNLSVVATFFTSLDADDLVGSSPTALALTPDRNTLFVANSGNNDVAEINVADPEHPKVLGFIPTAWYPTALFVTPEGGRLIVGTAKGTRGEATYPGIQPQQELTDDLKHSYDYLPNRLEGDAAIVDLPDRQGLSAWTAACHRFSDREISASMRQEEQAMIPTLRKIKHVVYIIRENRTYDQVLGDLQGTNADPDLCMYGEKITPNGHKIARTFKAFDNLYCDGEVSQDGHQWCCAAYCTDFKEKTWPSSYARRGQPNEDPSVTNSPGGYIWDNCRKHGVSYRSYGLSASFFADRDSAPRFENGMGLDGHSCEAWFHPARDKDRVDVFIQEMRDAEKTGNWPSLMVMSLGEDHTSGRKPGEFTPFAKVASNDLGLGKLVDAVSHSRFWSETAIFVIEDDAQNGPDHVDGHRTVGFVVSPYLKRGGVDHHLYSTASMVRTIELILGLPPMSQLDRHATSMVASFGHRLNLTAFVHEDARIDLSAKNPAVGALAEQSLKLDLSAYDRADPDKLNRILWADAKPGRPYPHRGGLSR